MHEMGDFPRKIGRDIEPSRPRWQAPRDRLAAPEYAGRDIMPGPSRAGRPILDDQDGYDGAEGPPRDWSSLAEHRVTLAAVALIIASLIWKAAFISHYYFRQDDFWLMDVAVRNGLSGHYIGRVWAGQFIPGAYVLGWLQVKVAPYSWTLGTAVEVVLIAGASLAAWRLLRTLLGNRPAILLPLALYLLSPVTFESYSWWISAVETIPLQLAIFASLDAHIRYVRTGRLRHAAVAAGWLAFGLFFFEKSALIPLLLFAVTAGFLVRRRSLLSAVHTTAVRFWRGWALYAGVVAIYLIAFVVELAKTTARPATPPSAHVALTFAWTLIFHSFVPSMFGGPWHWYIVQEASGGGAAPPPELAWLALLAVAVIIVATVLTRRRAWRAWAILIGWLAVDDIMPVLLGRVANFPSYAVVLGNATRYVADTPAVLAITVALVFWPVALPEQEDREPGQRRREPFDSPDWRKAAVALVGVFALGSVWTVFQYQSRTVVPARSYVANAKSALAQVPAGTVVVDRPVPSDVMVPLYGTGSDTSVVLGPLSPPGRHLVWAAQPTGNIANLRMFGPDGRLDTAAIRGVTAQAPSVFANCLTPRHTRLVVSLPVQPGLAPYTQVLRIGYLATANAANGSVTISYNGIVRKIPIVGKSNNAYLPVTGSAPNIIVQATMPAGAFCFEKAVAGYFIPLAGTGVPRA